MVLRIFLLCFVLASCGANHRANADAFYKSVGMQIRQERLDRGMSQQALADSVSISQNTLSLIEDGLATPIHTKLIEIQNYLGVKFEIDGKESTIEDYLKENKIQ